MMTSSTNVSSKEAISRQQCLDSFNEFINKCQNDITAMLDTLGWTPEHFMKPKNVVVCPHNGDHSMPKSSLVKHQSVCELVAQGYSKEEAGKILEDTSYFYENASCVYSVKIDLSTLNSVLWNHHVQNHSVFYGYKKVPQTPEEEQQLMSREDRLSVSEYIIKRAKEANRLKELGQDELLVSENLADLIKKDTEERKLDPVEEMAALRDYRRRRQTYRAKNVHITKKSHTEIMREVINNQMEMYAQTVKEELGLLTPEWTDDKPTDNKDRSQHRERRSRSRDTTSRRSRSKDTISRRSRSRDTTSRKSRSRDTTSRSSRSRDTISRRSRSRDTTSRRSRSRDTTSRRSRSRDTTSRRSRSRDTTSRRSRSRDTISRRSRSRDTTSRRVYQRSRSRSGTRERHRDSGDKQSSREERSRKHEMAMKTDHSAMEKQPVKDAQFTGGNQSETGNNFTMNVQSEIENQSVEGAYHTNSNHSETGNHSSAENTSEIRNQLTREDQLENENRTFSGAQSVRDHQSVPDKQSVADEQSLHCIRSGSEDRGRTKHKKKDKHRSRSRSSSRDRSKKSKHKKHKHKHKKHKKSRRGGSDDEKRGRGTDTENGGGADNGSRGGGDSCSEEGEI